MVINYHANWALDTKNVDAFGPKPTNLHTWDSFLCDHQFLEGLSSDLSSLSLRDATRQGLLFVRHLEPCRDNDTMDFLRCCHFEVSVFFVSALSGIRPPFFNPLWGGISLFKESLLDRFSILYCQVRVLNGNTERKCEESCVLSCMTLYYVGLGK